MKNIRLFELESEYLAEKESLEYPTVSYIREIEQVGYVKKPIPNSIIATYHITENDITIGQTIALAEGVVGCSDIILDGVSLATPITTTNHVATPTSFGTYDTITFTEDSWAKSPANPWNVTFNRPLTENDMFLFAIEVTGESMIMPISIEEASDEGIMTPLDDTLQNWQCMYAVSTVGMDFNMVVCAFTPQDDNSTIAEDNFVGASYEVTNGGVPGAVIVTPTEPTTYTVQYIITEGEGDKVLINRISSYASSVDLSHFNASHMTDMSHMFESCYQLTFLDLSSFDTSNVTDMSYMFGDCYDLTSLDLSNFDTSNVTNMAYMFYQCYSLTSLDLSSFDTSNVTRMDSLVQGCSSLRTLIMPQDISNVYENGKIDSIFFHTSDLTVYHEGKCNNTWYNLMLTKKIPWDTNFVPSVGNTNLIYITETVTVALAETVSMNVKIINNSYCDNIYKVYVDDKKYSYDFTGSLRLSGGTHTCKIGILEAHQLTDMSNMFSGCSAVTSIDLSSLDTSNVTNMENMFYYCTSLTSLDLSSFNTSNVTNMRWMFRACSGLTSLDVSNFNTSNVTDMDNMFYECSGLTSLDVSSFNTSKVTDIGYMFSDCKSLTFLDVSNFDTSNVKNMGSMFYNCSSLTSLDVSNFDTSNVTNMHNMFARCNKLTSLDLSNFNTSKVTDMYCMFRNCYDLTSLDLSNFDTSNVTNMDKIFYNCASLTSLDLSNFNTSKVTDMEDMFRGCKSLTSLDLSNFNTSNVTDMENMFYECSGLTSLDLSSFDTSNVTDMAYMFYSCINLTSVTMVNSVAALSSAPYMFKNTPTTGTFYYNGDYDYSKIIEELPSTWTAVNINS